MIPRSPITGWTTPGQRRVTRWSPPTAILQAHLLPLRLDRDLKRLPRDVGWLDRHQPALLDGVALPVGAKWQRGADRPHDPERCWPPEPDTGTGLRLDCQ